MGILTYPKKLFDLRSINKYFKILENLDKDDVMVRDQTYYMIYFQQKKQKMVALNEDKYHVYGITPTSEVVANRRNSNTICCHYTSTVRDAIYKEGIITMFKMRNL